MPLSRITGNSFSPSANTNIDNNTLFVNPTTNRIGLGTNNPSHQLTLRSDAPYIAFYDTESANGNYGTITSYQSGSMYYDADAGNVESAANANHIFRTNGGGEIIRIRGTGGIEFPGTQISSGGANVLDDYEEGTWSPTITGSSSGTATGGSVVGTYTKIGRMVHARFTFVNLSSNLGITGSWRISLPFTLKLSVASEYMGGSITYNRYVNVSGNWLSLWNSTDGSNFILLYANYMNGTESVPVSGTIPGNMLLSGEIVYETA